MSTCTRKRRSGGLSARWMNGVRALTVRRLGIGRDGVADAGLAELTSRFAKMLDVVRSLSYYA